MTTITETMRRAMRTCRAVAAFTVKYSPKWLLPVLGVCLLIPGPVDELIVLAVVLVPVLRSAQERAELAAMVAAAWKGAE